ncbi:type II secretion system protein [Actinomadura sp. DC4]|uniref:type II secretion system F family protein n=1 Tax=Actinomadura sp. DC4 TaxID=3055069 RepID=UPI0025AEFCA7|nr:type II secretion system protein [Actinomadura sp. DC4]MDN3354545.1 type II secretion system protein [Actinomadura sp. DC4]
MTAAASVACVFAAVWILLLPSPATLRLTAVLRTAPDPSRRSRPPAVIAWLRTTAGALTGRRRDVAKRRAAVIELCDGIAAELTAGRPAAVALIEAARVLPAVPGLPSVIDAAERADDVPAALTEASAAEGCEGLRLLAGCWRIGMDRGGMLASVIEGLAEALRDEQSHREEIALQLAGPRATARLLAGLPALGLGMAAVLGARPLTFLFASLPGALCLSLGLTLDATGLWWTARLARSAERTQ